MTREIKFRAWDEENKQFADYEDIEECLSCQSRDGWKSSDGMGCCFGINAVEILADCIIEQYTGLKDKNGKEIYECDILEWTDGFDEKHIFMVEWQENRARFCLRNPGCHWDYEEINDKKQPYIEVIGNIHENPELLK